jgi:hypothetical protein
MKAYEVLSDSSKWTQRYFAQDTKGRLVDWDDKDACKWCLIGALRKTYPNFGCEPAYYSICARVMDEIRKHKSSDGNEFHSMAQFNDHIETTYEKVVKILKDADV